MSAFASSSSSSFLSHLPKQKSHPILKQAHFPLASAIEATLLYSHLGCISLLFPCTPHSTAASPHEYIEHLKVNAHGAAAHLGKLIGREEATERHIGALLAHALSCSTAGVCVLSAIFVHSGRCLCRYSFIVVVFVFSQGSPRHLRASALLVIIQDPPTLAFSLHFLPIPALAPTARYALIEQRCLMRPCDMTIVMHHER